MHITEGVVPVSVAVTGGLCAAGGVAIGLRALKDEQIPRAALMSAVIFASSLLVRLPVGPSSVHPVLNGLAGILLGWAAVPVFLVSLFLEALLFQFGGITTLGVNTVTMAAPAVVSYACFSGPLRRARSENVRFLLGVGASMTALLLSFALWSAALVLSGKSFVLVVKLALLPHLVLMGAEGILTGFVVAFLARIYPGIFALPAESAPGEAE